MGAASAAKPMIHQIADRLVIPAVPASRLTPLLQADVGFVGNAPAEHGWALQIAQLRLQRRDRGKACGLGAQDARPQLQALEARLAQLLTVTR